MDPVLDRLAWDRARARCEYCHLPQAVSPLTHEIDHIIALKHRGETTAENLALAGFFCNSYKGPNLAGIDPESGTIVRLFHPRTDRWPRHFRWYGPALTGRTRSGRATVAVLEMNRPGFVSFRAALLDEGHRLD